MMGSWRRAWSRALLGTLAAGMVFVLAGDRGITQAPPGVGIDPLAVLDFQTIPNILFLVDTSHTMGATVDNVNYFVGGDDKESRLYQVKAALRKAIAANKDIANFGVAQFGPGNDKKVIVDRGVLNPGRDDFNRGPFIYVSTGGTDETKDVGDLPDDPIIADAWARIFDQGGKTSDTVTPADFDWAGCGSCTYDNAGNTTCAPACTNEFLRTFTMTENGFGTPNTGIPCNGIGYPAKCAKATPYKGRFYIKSRVFWNNIFFQFSPGPGTPPNTDTSLTAQIGVPQAKVVTRGLKGVTVGVTDPNSNSNTVRITCPPPPPGLLGDDVLDTNDGIQPRPCFQLEIMIGNTLRATKKARMTFYLASAAFGLQNKDEGCPDGTVRNAVGPCGDTAYSTFLSQKGSLRLELPVLNPTTGLPFDTVTGVPDGLVGQSLSTFPATNWVGVQPLAVAPGANARGGIQLGGDGKKNGDNTPIAASLLGVLNHYNTDVFPSRAAAAAGKQRNFVILITDGNENCDGDAVAAAKKLYDNGPQPPLPQIPPNRIETIVIVFPSGSADSAQADAIARAGSGGTRDALQGGNLQVELSDAISQTLGLGNTGFFSASQTTVTESIFEYFSPVSPDTRYATSQPIVFQPTFRMPGFEGHLQAFWNPPACSGSLTPPDCDAVEASVPRWAPVADAGDHLLARVSIPSPALFADLHAGATPSGIRGSSALVKRRIFTTTRNGVLRPTTAFTPTPNVNDLILRTAQADVRALWPPSSDVTSSPFVLDVALGIAATSVPPLTAVDFQNQFGACLGSPLPVACSAPTSAANQLIQRRKEAREMILAFTAGARVVTTGGLPQRKTLAPALGELLYEKRPWILGESTLSAPAVVGPPLESKPGVHLNEYTLFRDGPRTPSPDKFAVNGIDNGFGLRNPDKDGRPVSAADNNLKPAMSVVYLGTNDMLHAFRAGPCVVAPCAETGGEELWGFVPFDQLGKLRERMRPQARNPHTYMIASALRFGEAFIPGAFTQNIGGVTVSGDGVWRTVLLFGRGIGGKYYTALDVTGPGPFTEHALDTNTPIVLWSRGNPDTNNGLTSGTKNNTLDSNFDYDAYLRMGETWSTPALANVVPVATKIRTQRSTAGVVSVVDGPDNNLRLPKAVEFLAYTGSGYSSVATEGTTFYGLDLLTGDVVIAADVLDGTATYFANNALVASPAVFTANQLVSGFVGNSAGIRSSRVYIGDVHGRLWKFNTPDPAKVVQATPVLFKNLGPDQPMSQGVALLNLNSDATGQKPHVYVTTGHDLRVPNPPATAPPPLFKILGLRDPKPDLDITTLNTSQDLFSIDLPAGFRGTARPATAFDDSKPPLGRVFFIGLKFNPANIQCVSTFDTILFAVGGATGGAAYDLNTVGDDRSTTLTGIRAGAVRVDRGRLIVDNTVLGETPPPPIPPAPPADVPGASGSGSVFVKSIRAGSPVCK